MIDLLVAAKKLRKACQMGIMGHSPHCNQGQPRCLCGISDILFALAELEKNEVVIECSSKMMPETATSPTVNKPKVVKKRRKRRRKL